MQIFCCNTIVHFQLTLKHVFSIYPMITRAHTHSRRPLACGGTEGLASWQRMQEILSQLWFCRMLLNIKQLSVYLYSAKLHPRRLCTIREKQLGIYATKNYGGHSGGKKGPTLIQMACEKCYRHIFLWKCAVALVITISFIRCLDRHELRWWEWRLFPDMRFLKLYKLSTLQSSLTHKPDRTSKRRPVLTVNYQNITLPRTPSPV